jgi:hypothetical protein
MSYAPKLVARRLTLPKPMKRTHDTLQAARQELRAHGYWPLHVPLNETRQPWAKAGSAPRLVIGCDADTDTGKWHIVEHVTVKTDWLD